MFRVLDKLAQPAKKNSSDYTNAEGYLTCGECHGRKEIDVELPNCFPNPKRRVAVMCECEQWEYRRRQEVSERAKHNRNVENSQHEGYIEKPNPHHVFAKDDRRNLKASDACKRYVEQWQQVVKDNIGLMFFGGVGTGKTFFAECIANELTKKYVTVGYTSMPRLLNKLQFAHGDRQEIIDNLMKFQLLIIDDLGVERDTAYSTEQAYNVINGRIKSGKPIIVTTNLSVEEMKNTTSQAHKRIYDRVLGMCQGRIRMDGVSRRIAEKSTQMTIASEVARHDRT